MKKIIRNTKNIIDSIKSGETNGSALPLPMGTEDIEEPDAEVLISKNIINEFLNQNFPFATSIKLDDTKQIAISVTAADIQTEDGNIIQLQITDASIQFEKLKFPIGLKSNAVKIKLNFGIRKTMDRFNLVISGDFSSLDVRFLPKWMERRIVDFLNTKFFSPLVDLDITPFLTIDTTVENEYGTVKFKKDLKDIAIQINNTGIRLKVKYC
ncbi:MAG: hypothetical protein GY866_38065 [Proteobacteria bacterium]|nr:hypothetical protein [Pseudomonadota bacterium]